MDLRALVEHGDQLRLPVIDQSRERLNNGTNAYFAGGDHHCFVVIQHHTVSTADLIPVVVSEPHASGFAIRVIVFLLIASSLLPSGGDLDARQSFHHGVACKTIQRTLELCAT